MIRPSNNFLPTEWVRSRDYPHLAIRLDELDSTKIINCMRLTLLFMQPTRDEVGILRALSWCRSAALNSAVGGVEGSSHLTGLGADVVPVAVPTQRLLDLALTGELASVGAEWDKLNFYSDENYYHVSLRPVEDGQSRFRIYRDWEHVS